MEYTYDTLLASCQNYCIDNSTQYETEFPFIVQVVETRIIKDLNLSIFDTVTTPGVMVTQGSQSVTKPSDMIAIQDFFIYVDSERKYLQQRSRSWLDGYWRNSTTQGEPAYFCDDTADNWLLAPTPDNAYTYQVNYIKRPASMSSSNQTTYIGSHLGEILLYATLVQSMGFFREDVQAEQGITQFWEQTYMREIQKALVELSPFISSKDNMLRKIVNVTP